MKKETEQTRIIMNSADKEDDTEIQYPTDEELEDMYKEFTRRHPEHSWIYPF